MKYHAYRRPASGTACEICGARPGAMVHLLRLLMMETAEQEREEAKAMNDRPAISGKVWIGVINGLGIECAAALVVAILYSVAKLLLR